MLKEVSSWELITYDMPMLIYLFAGILLFCLITIGFEWFSVYHPTKKVENTPEQIGLEFHDQYFMTRDDKRLHGWWLPHPEPQATMLYCHGNRGNMGDRLTILKTLHELGYEVFIFDYRGYGNSRGIPSEKGTRNDVLAAHEMTRTLRTPDIPLIVYGRSLGGAVAAQLVETQPVDGLILDSTFTSIPDMARELYPFLPRGVGVIQYNTLKKISAFDCPILIVHSREDTFIPYHMGESLRNAVRKPVEWMDLKGSHSEHPFDSTDGYDRKIQEFVSKCK